MCEGLEGTQSGTPCGPCFPAALLPRAHRDATQPEPRARPLSFPRAAVSSRSFPCGHLAVVVTVRCVPGSRRPPPAP